MLYYNDDDDDDDDVNSRRLMYVRTMCLFDSWGA